MSSMVPMQVEDALLPHPMRADPTSGHILKPVADDWEAIEVWLQAVRAKRRDANGATNTNATYRYHLAKLCWYVEHVCHITPSRWSMQDVEQFATFLKALPADALCPHGVAINDPVWRPFRVRPSASSQADIRRFVHAMFNGWHKAGYVRHNPTALPAKPMCRVRLPPRYWT
ncbi:hypothetical protein [Actimicrobium antarcticum]|uniref:Core-binding (CB) domain-containing protein n=1 Tax=Actimicrobium antarcticum TaxID=1051899 RepID=A0ABP7SX93_9BURK